MLPALAAIAMCVKSKRIRDVDDIPIETIQLKGQEEKKKEFKKLTGFMRFIKQNNMHYWSTRRRREEESSIKLT